MRLKPVLRLKLRLLLNYIVAKHKSDFSHGSGLVLEVAALTEGGSRRDVRRVNPGKISAKEEASVLKGGRHGDRRASAARTEHQIDHIRILAVPRTGDIFK